MKPITIFMTLSDEGSVVVTNAEIAEISDKAYWAGYRDGLHRAMMSVLKVINEPVSESEGRTTE